MPASLVPMPASLVALLGEFRGCFSAWTFPVFCGLACGLLAQGGRRTVCGMLVGAQLSRTWSHHCRVAGRSRVAGGIFPLPAPVKPDVNLSIHPASGSQLLCVGSSPMLGWLVHHSPFAWGLCSTLITRASLLIRPSPPQCVASEYSRLRLSGLGVLPFPGLTRDNHTTGSSVRYESQYYAHATYTPDTAWPERENPPDLSRGSPPTLGSDVI